MGLGHMNIWLRNDQCLPLTDCWRADLVVKTCHNVYLLDFYPEILSQLTNVLPAGTTVTRLDNYQGETRISIRPPAGTFINHIELDLPPGCYKVWCRVCHGKNEETNKVMVMVGCDDRACVNLLLNSVSTCGKEIFHPAAIHVIDKGFLIEEEIKPFFKLLMNVAYVNHAIIQDQLNGRILEAQEKGDTTLENKINQVLNIINQMPECC